MKQHIREDAKTAQYIFQYQFQKQDQLPLHSLFCTGKMHVIIESRNTMQSMAASIVEVENFSKFAAQDPYTVDIEQKAVDDAHLMNNTVQDFVWQGVTVTVKDFKTKEPKAILDNVDGIVKAGRA
jgi:hypothetical protein